MWTMCHPTLYTRWNWQGGFIVCKVACVEALNGVLMQEHYVKLYKLRKLKEHEKKFVAHDLELATIVDVLKICRHYLLRK